MSGPPPVPPAITGGYQHQGWIVRQIFPDTDDTEFLETHCRLRDISRKAANTSTDTITATGNVGAPATAGLVINVGSLSYTTTAAGERLLSFGDSVIKTVFNDLKPAHTFCYFSYQER